MSTSEEIRIQNFRVSFIWCETYLVLLDKKKAVPHTPFSFLETGSSYASEFDLIRNSRNKVVQDINILLPWERMEMEMEKESLFWSDYVLGERSNNRNLTGTIAWKSLVPFRGKSSFDITPWPLPRFSLETFYYPSGFAYVLTAYYEGQFALEEVVEKAFALREEGKEKFKVNVHEEKQRNYLFDKLDDLVEEVMTSTRHRILGTGVGSDSISRSLPFTIVTIIQGSGVPLETSPQMVIHQALEGLTNWNPQFKLFSLTPLEQANLLYTQPAPAPPPSDILYATPRGRAIWFPRLFSSQPYLKNDKNISQIHRELVLLTMQAESLCGFIRRCDLDYSNIARINGLPTIILGECVGRVGNILGRLYGEGRLTYQDIYGTLSFQAQLELNDMVSVINRWREKNGQGPLHKKVKKT